jgi:tripartite ATP-independent transporter DctM subunit
MTLILVALLLLLLIGMSVPVAFAILGASIGYFLVTPSLDIIVAQRMVGSLESFPLLAIPLFVLAGTIMAQGGIAERLIGFADVLVGHMRGGLAQVNVINSVLIGGMSGSATADAAIDSKVLVPIMRQKGYSNGFASALTATSSAFGPLLPPSISLVLYGVMANVSIADLFLAGIGAAAFMVVVISIVVHIMAVRNGYERSRERRATLREVWHAFRRSIFALLMPVLLLVGLRIGIFTPTELGAVAVFYALVVSIFIYREISWANLPDIFVQASATTAVIMLIIAAASAFGLVVSYEQIPMKLATFLDNISVTPVLFLLGISVLLLLLGTVLETVSLMIVLIPVLAPIGASMGIEPVQLAIVLVLVLTIGGITPPVGTIMFTVCTITGCSFGEFTRAFIPFLMAMLFCLVVIILVPQITTGLPTMLRH